jgi:hypothetical protein
MKTIGYKDNAGGMINCYFNRSNPTQKRQDRVISALSELKHTGNITVYLIDGNKVRKLFRKGM